MSSFPARVRRDSVVVSSNSMVMFSPTSLFSSPSSAAVASVWWIFPPWIPICSKLRFSMSNWKEVLVNQLKFMQKKKVIRRDSTLKSSSYPTPIFFIPCWSILGFTAPRKQRMLLALSIQVDIEAGLIALALVEDGIGDLSILSDLQHVWHVWHEDVHPTSSNHQKWHGRIMKIKRIDSKHQ